MYSTKQRLAFLMQFMKTPLRVGSAIPSSSWLAERVSQCISPSLESGSPKHYLEVGAGTGKLSKKIIEKMGPKDYLDIVEVDEAFCAILHRNFGHLHNVHIHQRSIFDWTSEACHYDAIISALPLNSFSPQEVAEIYKIYEKILKNHGKFSYIEIMGVPTIGKLFFFSDKKRRLEEVQQVKQDFFKKNNGISEMVWWNIPPMRVCHCSLLKDIFDDDI